MSVAAIAANDALAHSGQTVTAPSADLSFGEAGLEFGRYGFKHILLGYDHLLFLAGLVLLCSGLRDVARIIGLFAVSYSAALLGSAAVGLALPGEPIDAVIALSVAYVGAQIAFGSPAGWLSRDPGPPAFAFGVAHGLGLSSLLQELRLRGDDLIPSALGFNVGVELGQIAAIAAFVGVLVVARAFPLPARHRIPAGLAFASGAAVLLAYVVLGPPPALGHTVAPPAPLRAPPPNVEEIPEEDENLYRSYVIGIRPEVPGLVARVVGRQDKLEVTWTGKRPLVVEGVEGEPMVRMSAKGIEINERSPSAHLATERYGRVTLPAEADAGAEPSWRRIESPGPISWFEHRAHWLRASRPHAVGNGARGVTIFHWRVPARLGTRRVEILGALDWLPDPSAVRKQRSEVSSPVLSALVLVAAMGGGALAGIVVRRRVEAGG